MLKKIYVPDRQFIELLNFNIFDNRNMFGNIENC